MKNNSLIKTLKIVNWPIAKVIIAIFISIVSVFVSLLVPIYIKEIIDKIDFTNLPIKIILLVISFFIIASFLQGLSQYLLSYIGELTIRDLRKNMWEYIINLPVKYYDNKETGQIMSRLIEDSSIVNNFVSMKLPIMLSQLILFFGALGLMIYMDWKITLFMLITVVVTTVIIIPLGNKIYVISTNHQQTIAEFSGILSRVLSDIRLVKIANAENLEIKRGNDKLERLFGLGIKQSKLYSFINPLITLIIMFTIIGILSYSGYRLSVGTLSTGTLVALLFYLLQIIEPLTGLSSFFTDYKKTLGATDRIQEIYKNQLENKAGFAPSYDQDISFQNVSFSYGEKEILKNVNFLAERNKVTAFVGPSGAGKSTIFSLLVKLYECQEGNIKYGDQSINNIDLTLWRSKIGYAMQNAPVMNGTVLDNITYGLTRSYSMEEIHTVAQIANAHEFIMNLENQFDTLVGERGILLSGGQKQRLALCRVFLHNPEILLLDEATSSLDSESEKHIERAINYVKSNKTTLIIAHRLSTIMAADHIIFLDDGKITGQGTHEELLNTHERYRDFVTYQTIK
ncbi:ABC transporter ATP-binding protein [Bacillus cereus]|uniref:ABC transporter ATP-binding protein n=2 Tax=Bacillus cereus TaxID=1396 RepID=A0AAW4QZF8_BACCE|nr:MULTISPECIES: ABC transporter ATP-binding protein [Bacillus cereus group]WIK99249.1 ABC transporter ATP-binding protein [Bacillus bombysepticus]MBY0039543.1 ABC transporter ATP-binding protein [Bacillus cereus]MCE9756968.1 ABC transporter ATP-binding protein/permease [Bacillus cereus]MDA2644732.1 ABC transporter ATP-binding protein [Bacillus cereus]MDZ4535102.1 ABC transporter ATP-binding protein [Bacillus cereus]